MLIGYVPVFSQIEQLFRWILDRLHYNVGLSWAWAIVALTVIVRVVIVPLAVKQIHSMQALQAHAPEMKEIQKRYRHDKQRQQQELMRFYKENNINPAASCLPLLVQIPIFIALYYVLRGLNSDFEAHKISGSLSWLHIFPNISTGVTSHWSGALLIVVYVLSQLASSWFMSTSAQRSQRIMMMVLPFIFVPVILRFPTGLVLYWSTTNLWTVGQGLITRTLIPQTPAPPRRSSRTPPAAGREQARETVPAQAQRRSTQPPRRVKRKKKKGGGRR
jgi:YidC/Oxa1 family membrane protein insertase